MECVCIEIASHLGRRHVVPPRSTSTADGRRSHTEMSVLGLLRISQHPIAVRRCALLVVQFFKIDDRRHRTMQINTRRFRRATPAAPVYPTSCYGRLASVRSGSSPWIPRSPVQIRTAGQIQRGSAMGRSSLRKDEQDRIPHTGLNRAVITSRALAPGGGRRGLNTARVVCYSSQERSRRSSSGSACQLGGPRPHPDMRYLLFCSIVPSRQR